MFTGLRDALCELGAIRHGKRAARALSAGDLNGYERGMQQAKALMSARFGDIFQTSVYSWNLGEALLAQGREVEALDQFRDTARICASVLRDAPSDLGQTGTAPVEHLMRVYAKIPYDPENSKAFDAVLASRADTLGQEDEKTAGVAADCIEAKAYDKDSEPALRMLSVVQDPILRRFGTDHPISIRVTRLADLMRRNPIAP